MRFGGLSRSALGIAVVLAFAGTAIFLWPLEPSIVRTQFTFSAAGFDAVFGGWTPLAQDRFKSHFQVDYILILMYGTWGYLHGASAPSTATLSRSRRSAVTWLLPLSGLADVVENILHSRFVLSAAGAAPEWQYLAAGLAATAKWSGAVGFVLLASVASLKHQRSRNAA